ncbi:emerin (Emery-Dreifuss muscular dystrophy) [Sinocyclocheilus rhinocerous]|uniref:Emerin-like n=1 Tax=Sinocyclocheilus rhinocerous TaxID=307959 RepID=A0A673LX88_9TELE|nr:PREDICTED: emerin-like [Sinocyclocheilus rhinocerous]XP_016373542.1 PREDICTED: emerin-like [Sinocyclocheilus rhinocerous]
MSSLSGKSDKEISQLLDEYGIKHGPIVESTRKLYEKKLNEAMGKKAKPSSPDKTYYREEKEEVEYITYHQPQPQLTRHDGFGDVTRRSKVTDADFAHNIRRSNLTDYRDDNIGYTNEPVISPTRMSYQSSSRLGPSVSTSMQRGPSSPETSKSGGVPGWLRILAFLIIAVFLYYVYTCMEPAEETPFKSVQ